MNAAFAVPAVADYDTFFLLFRSPFHMVMDGLLLGVLCAVIFRDRASFTWLTVGNRAGLLFWIGALGLAWLLCAENLMARITLYDKTLQPTAISACFAAMMLSMLLGGGPRRMFRAVSLFFLARISFSLYLIHLPLTALCLALIGKGAEFGPFLLVFAAVSVAAALVIHFAVEKPFLILKDRL